MSAMNIIKRNKYAIICLLICTGVLILGIVGYKWLFPNAGKSVYGNRLDGIEKVSISEKKLSEINNKIKENASVVKVNSNISGKVINIIIEVAKDTKVEDAKKFSTTILENFSEEEIAFYDFQVYLNNEDLEVEGYPIIGYKVVTNKEFSFNLG